MIKFNKIIALVLSVILTFSIGTVAFAQAPASAKTLNELGLLSNISDSDMSAKLTRDIGLTMILKALGYTTKEADAAAPGSPFKDTKTWTAGWAALAFKLGITAGTSTTTFDPQGALTEKQFVAFMLRALGYETNEAYAKAAELGVNAGLVKTGDALDALSYTKADASEVMIAALSATMQDGSGKLLIDTLITKGVVTQAAAITAGLVKAAPTVLTPLSVVAPNARQVVITFNKEVTTESINTDNVKIFVGSATTVSTWTKLVEGATVTLVLTTSIEQDTDVKVVLKDIAAAANTSEKLPETTKIVRMKDITAPSILGVIASTSKTITITTSEPLMYVAGTGAFHVMANVLIDGVKLVAKISPDYSKNTATIELGSKLSIGNHTVTIEGFKDIVGFAVPKYEGIVTVLEDKATPNIISVETISRSQIKVIFDEPVSVLGTLTVDGNAIGSSLAAADKKSYTINLLPGKELGLASLIRTIIAYVGTVDEEGNAITGDGKTFNFISTDDLIAPTVVISFTADNRVKVVFSEVMSSTGTLTVKNASNVVQVMGSLVLDTSDTTNKTYITSTINPISQAGVYTVELKDSKDNGVRLNSIVAFSSSLSSMDTTVPRVSLVLSSRAYASGTSGQATIYFSEAMDGASITKLSNYFVDLDGVGSLQSTLPLDAITGAYAVAAVDGKSVVLTIPGAAYSAGISTVSVLAVKDISGTLLASADFNSPFIIAAAAGSLGITNYDMVDTNKVKVTFSRAMGTVDPSEFKIYNNAGDLTFVGISYELDTTGKVVTITLNGSLTTEAKAVATDSLVAKLMITGSNTKDLYGATAVLSLTPVVDKIAPAIATIVTGADLNTFVVTFTERVNATMLANDLIVRDTAGVIQSPTFVYAPNQAACTSATVTIAGSSGKTFTVELLPRSIVDSNGNVVSAKTPTAVLAK